MPPTIETYDRLTPELVDTWRALVPDRRWSFFSTPEWCQAIWRHFGPTRALRVMVAREDGEPVGLLPVWIRRMNQYGAFLTVAELFGSRRGDYGGPVIREEEGPRPDVFAELWEAALDLDANPGTIIWPNLPAESGYVEALESLLDRRDLTWQRRKGECRIIPLGETLEETMGEWSRNLRKNMRRYDRKLGEEQGEVRLQVFDTAADARVWLPRFFTMHDRRWEEAGSPGTFSEQARRDFTIELAEEIAGDSLHFSALMVGEEPAAYWLGFVSGGYLLGYKTTFNLDLYSYSPGKILIKYLVDEGITRGWKGIDLMQGDYDYKSGFTSEAVTTYTYTVRTRPTAPAYWWLTRGRPLAESAVGGLVFRARGLLHRLRRGRS